MSEVTEKEWAEYVSSIDDSKRCEVISKYDELCDVASHYKSSDVMEYLLFIYTGKVAPMPDISLWT